MADIVKRLRWDAENSATASRLNMAMDQLEAANEIELLQAALKWAVIWGGLREEDIPTEHILAWRAAVE